MRSILPSPPKAYFRHIPVAKPCPISLVTLVRTKAPMATLKRKADATGSAADLKKPKKDSSLTAFFGAPKVSNSTASSASLSSSNGATSEAPAPRFDKDKWVSTLTAEQKKLLKLEIDTLDPSWLVHLKEELVSREFLDLKRFLQREVDSGKKIFPPFAEIYSW